MASEDKNRAKEYVLDPLTAPQPADETGPGTSFRPEPESNIRKGMTTPPGSKSPPPRAATKKVLANATEVSNGYPSPKSPPQHRQEAFVNKSDRRSRSTSLGGRYPGDISHRPLDQLTHEKAVADKSRHITKKHHIRPDGVDLLDESTAGGAYHHGGPYDATLFARNNSYKSSPVNAVAGTNNEALKATPKEKIIDSVQGHRPLDGVATYEPGQIDPSGHEYQYEQGDNMMIDNNPEGGAYKRWPGVAYHPDDIKGKGEPSYSIEKALKKTEDQKGTELLEQYSPRNSLGQAFRAEGYSDGVNEMKRSDSLGKRLSGGLKKRIGSLKRNSRHED